jgi:hypothetical protein
MATGFVFDERYMWHDRGNRESRPLVMLPAEIPVKLHRFAGWQLWKLCQG